MYRPLVASYTLVELLLVARTVPGATAEPAGVVTATSSIFRPEEPPAPGMAVPLNRGCVLLVMPSPTTPESSRGSRLTVSGATTFTVVGWLGGLSVAWPSIVTV